MAFNLKEIANFIMPLVQSGKEEEAQNLLAQAGKNQTATKAKSGKGGLLDVMSGSLGGNDGGLLGSLGSLLGSGDAGPLSGLASVLPSLLKLIRPEHAAMASRYLAGLVTKTNKAPAKKTTGTAKKTPAAKKVAAAKKTTATAKKTSAAKKAVPAKKTTATTKKLATAKKTTTAKKPLPKK